MSGQGVISREGCCAPKRLAGRSTRGIVVILTLPLGGYARVSVSDYSAGHRVDNVRGSRSLSCYLTIEESGVRATVPERMSSRAAGLGHKGMRGQTQQRPFDLLGVMDGEVPPHSTPTTLQPIDNQDGIYSGEMTGRPAGRPIRAQHARLQRKMGGYPPISAKRSQWFLGVLRNGRG